MTPKKWLKDNCDLINKQYFYRGSKVYCGRLGCEGSSTVAALASKFNLTQIDSTWGEGKPANIGFSELGNEWFGWSHRAAKSFSIGSTVTEFQSGYFPTTKEEALEVAIRWWSDQERDNVRGEILDDSRIKITWIYSDKIQNKKLLGVEQSIISHYKLGKGEWTAKTVEDAKQMAKDFAEDVA